MGSCRRCVVRLAVWIICWLVSAAPLLLAATDPSTGSSQGESGAADLNNRGITEARAGRFEVGIDYLRQALRADPKDPLLRTNLSGMLTDWALQLERQGKLDEAEQALLEASVLDGSNAQSLAALGDLAYFKRSDFDRAISFWTRAHARMPGPERRALADRISQAQRDREIERKFRSEATAHFEIRIPPPGNLTVTELGSLLEELYAQLATELGGGPSKITVILYTGGDLHRTYNQRDWALGFYDGRLRLLWDEVGAELQRPVIAHELAHAFLHHRYGDPLPIWVHEGFAQLHEGARPREPEEQQIEERVISGAAWVPLKWLDRHFSQPSGSDDLWRAYVQSRLVVAELVKRHGMERMNAFLDGLSKGATVETAYEQAFAPARWARTDRTIFE